MEAILQKCCTADNELIQQGSKELKAALKNPEAIAALCNVVVTAQDADIRQYAAVVLGLKLAKYKHWAKISAEDRAVIKQGILQALVNEPNKPVKNSIANFIGVIMKHEAPKSGWPELQQALFELPSSNDPAQRQMGMYLLSILVDMNPKLFIPQADKLCALVMSILNTVNSENAGTPEVCYAIEILKSLSLGTQKVQVIVNTTYEAVPVVVKAIYALSKDDDDQAVKFIQLLDDLSDNVPLVFDPHLKLVVDMCLGIARESSLSDQVQIKALAFLGLLITKKKKALVKHNLVQPILDTLFLVVANPTSEEEELDDDDDTPSTVANQALDSMALNLPPAKVVVPMLKHIEAGMESVKPFPRKAACLTMAVMAEGCAEYIRTKYLKQFIQYVLKGIQDEFAIVRNAAFFALGQFSEHLQPDISNYSEQVMPVLFSYLDNLCQLKEEMGSSSQVTRMFYALEMFCENLNERLTPYLQAVVDRLLHLFSRPDVSVKVRELAISALNSAASAAKEEMAPHVPRVLAALHGFLTQPQSAEFLGLQIHSVDTLAVLARSLGKDNFRPLANESLQIAMTLIEKVDDPDLRKTTYGLLGALSGIMGTEMEGVLEAIVTVMVGALTSEEGNAILDIEDKDEKELAVYADVSDEDDEEILEDGSIRSDSDGIQVHIEDAFTEEKEEACSALAELAKNTGSAFLPHFKSCFSHMVCMINHPGISVRCAALDAFAKLTAAVGAAAPDQAQVQQEALWFIVPKCAELIQTDYERDVVGAALDALDTLLVEIKGAVLQREGHLEAIINSIMQVLCGKTQCQEDEEEPTEEDGEAEQDEMLFEYAGNIIPSLGKAMPHERFLEFFKQVLPLLLSKAQEHSSSAQKSFVVGTLAETMAILGPDSATYFNQLLPLFLNFATLDDEDEVRNNAMFALGELVLHSKEAAFPSYPSILIQLSQAIAKETVATNLDNICGALARMIISNAQLVPIESVLPVFLEKLPLREDFEENLSIFQCLNHLYKMGNPTMKEQIPAVIRVALTVVYRKEHNNKETLDSVINLLTNIKQDFPAELEAATNALTPEQLEVLKERLS